MATEHDVVPENENPQADPPSTRWLDEFSRMFPGAIRDGVLDAAQVGELLGVEVAGLKGGKERFGLMWAGKRDAVVGLQTPSLAALAPEIESSTDWDTAQNVFIEGDNLEVLKLMQSAYNDQVNLIYIDPPYNTGNDFVYNDDFSDPLRHHLEVTGQIDAEGNRLVANPENSGRKHSNWLTMMYPRLVLARNLLTEEGTIFLSIDDNEVHNLRILLDEIFGPENFIGQFVWSGGRKNDAKFVSASHEYMIAYARNSSVLKEKVGEWRIRKEGLDAIYQAVNSIVKKNGDDFDSATKDLKAWFKSLPNNDPAKRHKHYSVVDARGVYFPADISWPGGGGPKYQVKHPLTGEHVRIPNRGWVYQEDRLNQLIAENRIHFGPTADTVPCVKKYLKDSETEVPYSVFYADGRASTKRLRDFLSGSYFEFPKDELVLQRVIEFASNRDGIILDFFAGSGTTAHSMILQNQKDGGTRRYVMVTLDEDLPEDSEAAKAGMKSVADITRLRLNKVIEAFPNAKAQGLRFLKLSSSQFKVATGSATDELDLDRDTLIEGATNDRIVAQILLKVGVKLDEPWLRVEIVNEACVIAAGVAIVLARAITDELVEKALYLDAQTVVFLEDAFGGRDAVKANAFYKFKQANKQFKTY